MASFNLKNRIQLFKILISKCRYANETKKACKDEVEHLRKQGFSIKTIRGYLTDYRSEILTGKKSRKYTNWVKYSLVVSRNEQQSIESDKAYAIAERTGANDKRKASELYDLEKQNIENPSNKKEKVTTKREVSDISGMIKEAEKLLVSDSYISVTLGLMLLTGRRRSEILKTATFKYVRDIIVLFDGQMKVKKHEPQRKPYEIFTLCNSNKIIKALDRLNKMNEIAGRNFKAMTAKQINSRTGKTINEKVNTTFRKYVDGEKLNAHKLRAIYAQTIYQAFHSEKTNKASYALSLGHKYEVIDRLTGKELTVIQTTSESYDIFTIEDSDIEALKNNLL